uniref:hypothetical protein n=1 Tax=Fuscoporia viticola TaxID=139386 RepID=UPI0023AA6B29|nr:hypothetical protein P1Q19_mgp14 [Fuscoporia viticola]WCF76845.1 hypothetical protein [Fuscoporia viticola]
MLIHLKIPLNISIKTFNRSFHISSINYNEDDMSDLKARIEALKESSNISTDNNSDDIMLTEEQAFKLNNLDGIIQSQKGILNNQKDSEFHLSSTGLNDNLQSEMSSFEEGLPNYGKTEVQESISNNTVADEKLGLFKLNAGDIVSNQNNIDLLTRTAALIGPFLAYRGLLRTYVSAVDPIASNFTPNNINEYNDIVKRRSLLVNKFNIVTVPIIGTYFLYLGFIKGNILPQSVEKSLGSANLASVSFLGRKYNIGKGLLVILTGGLYWLTKTYVIPAYKIEYPESYNYITAIISNYGLYILLNSLFLWCFGLCIFYAIEIYIFLIFSIKKEGINLPKHLPKMTKIWLKRLEEDSKSEYKEAYVHIYGRTLLIHLLIVLIIVFIKFWFLV